MRAHQLYTDSLPNIGHVGAEFNLVS